MTRTHELCRGDSASRGVALATEDEGNLSFHRHFGRSITGEKRVGPIHALALWRADD